MYEYLVYDVFTEKMFGGNQLAVFPNATDIPEHFLQSIAAEFNFSEVTFVYPPSDEKNTARVRIFTPTSEIDFAGHPIIGTIFALNNLGIESPMILEVGVGPLDCNINETGASFSSSVELEKIAEPDLDLVASALSLPKEAIETSSHKPQQLSLGLPFVITELKSRELLASCKSNIAKVSEGAERYPAGLDFALFAYYREGNKISSRMFAPLDQIPEDPATGSASATLTALLTELSGEPQDLIFSQGEDMGRPSRISVTSTINPSSVTVTGNAIKIMEGKLLL